MPCSTSTTGLCSMNPSPCWAISHRGPRHAAPRDTREDRGLAQAYGEPIPPCRRSQCPHGDLRLHMAMARAEGRASPELSRPPDGQNTQLRGHWAWLVGREIEGALLRMGQTTPQ